MGRQRQGDETGRSKERIAYERFHGLTSMSVTGVTESYSPVNELEMNCWTSKSASGIQGPDQGCPSALNDRFTAFST